MNKFASFAAVGIIGGFLSYLHFRPVNHEYSAPDAQYPIEQTATMPEEHSVSLEDQIKAVEKLAGSELGKKVSYTVKDDKIISLKMQDYAKDELDMQNLPYLQTLQVYNCGLKQVKNLGKDLKNLYLIKNEIAEIDLSGLDNLEDLVLNFNPLSDVNGLQDLQKLRRLCIGPTNIRRLGSIPGSVRYISVYDINKITDMENIRQLRERGVEIFSDIPEQEYLIF